MTPPVIYTTDDGCFDCDSCGDSLRFKSEQAQKQITIAVHSIICIVPKDNRGETVYSLLYLRNDAENERLLLDSILLVALPRQLSNHLCAQLPPHLCFSGSRRGSMDIIVSTTSGTGTGASFFNNILRPLLSHLGVTEYDVHETQSTQTITELCHAKFIPRARERLQQTILLLSGDGGLTDIIDAFHSTLESLIVPPTIALIPTGTGNAMANSLGLLAYPTTGLVALLRGTPANIPTFAADFSPGARYIIDEGRQRVPISRKPMSDYGHPRVYGGVVASWGMHAALVADSDTVEYRRFGADRFKLAAKEILYPSDGTEPHKFRGAVTLFKWDDQTKSRREDLLSRNEHMYVLASLVSSLEKDFMISPLSRPLDGRLWMVHFGPISPSSVMQVMTSAYQKGQHVGDESVFYDEIEGFRIELDELDERWRRICIDGKIIAVETGGWVEVHKDPKRLLNILLLKSFPPSMQ
ncbi:glycogen synthase kinase mutation revertant [Aspergillus sclerotiicarbonarius CBS 121057]|uniref:Glycogen synthase kinase mutation revertant n=1 Tax=Aspergillus sclerotiicarbonarius (strain CBS 121057 / IBT 28362) TaxID=1448318 RepID=A0A319EBV7_ASPSB|nr:glycogen synthase kinase mutation revertant [Aspergillus sclerotiicarbonarius CBS 121057]